MGIILSKELEGMNDLVDAMENSDLPAAQDPDTRWL